MNTETKTIGHPDRFAYKEDGAVDWPNSAGMCVDRARAMVDMIYAYVSANRGSFPDLFDNTLDSLTHAIHAELQDVGKLVGDWHMDQCQKEQAKGEQP